MGLHPTKRFCTAMEAINKMKRPPTEREEVFSKNIPPNIQGTHTIQHQKKQAAWFKNGQRI